MVSALPDSASSGKYSSIADEQCFNKNKFSSQDSETQEINLNQNKRSRRQWSVHGEPKSIFKRLRSQLAEDGCAESQYLMARALLDCKEVPDYEESCHQAVFWLTQSSLQGSQIATKELKECLQSGTGICDKNYKDVIECLQMDLQEKLAIVAGKQMFYCLNEGTDFVSLRKLKLKIREIGGLTQTNQDEEFSWNPNSLAQSFGSERLTETVLVEAAKSYVQGNIPEIPIDHCPVFSSRVFCQPLEKLYFNSLHMIHSPFKAIIKPIHPLVFLFIACIIGIISFTAAFVVCVYVLLTAAFTSMIYSVSAVLSQLYNKKKFLLWSEVFKNFNPEIDVALSEKEFQGKLRQFYFIYYAGLVVYLCLMHFMPSCLMTFFYPLLAFVSLLLSISILESNVAFNIFSAILWTLAHYSEGHVFIREFVVNQFPFLEDFVYQGSFEIFNSFHVHMNIGSIFHCLWFTSLMFASYSLGIQRVLHLILCLSWYHMMVTVPYDVNWSLYSSCLWICVFVLPFTYKILIHLVPAVVIAMCAYSCQCDETISLLIFFVASAIIYFIRYQCGSTATNLLMSLILFIGVTFLLRHQLETSNAISSLKWEQYQSVCLPSKDGASVFIARNCSPLKGTVVQWQAIVKYVEVESISNWVQDVASLFPKPMKPAIECLFGEKVSPCNHDLFLTDTELEQCISAHLLTDSQCSIEKWNRYVFNIVVSMESNFWKFRKTTDVILKGDNNFHDVAFKLYLNDRISFIGSLQGVKLTSPEVSLLALSCADCRINTPDIDARTFFNIETLYSSLKSALNFFLFPTLTI